MVVAIFYQEICFKQARVFRAETATKNHKRSVWERHQDKLRRNTRNELGFSDVEDSDDDFYVPGEPNSGKYCRILDDSKSLGLSAPVVNIQFLQSYVW